MCSQMQTRYSVNCTYLEHFNKTFHKNITSFFFFFFIVYDGKNTHRSVHEKHEMNKSKLDHFCSYPFTSLPKYEHFSDIIHIWRSVCTISLPTVQSVSVCVCECVGVGGDVLCCDASSPDTPPLQLTPKPWRHWTINDFDSYLVAYIKQKDLKFP